jgi:hypothetical protein
VGEWIYGVCELNLADGFKDSWWNIGRMEYWSVGVMDKWMMSNKKWSCGCLINLCISQDINKRMSSGANYDSSGLSPGNKGTIE